MGARNLESSEHGRRIRDPGHLGPDSRGGTTTDDPNVSLLEAVVGTSYTQEEEGKEDDGADDEEDLELSERLESSDRSLRKGEGSWDHGGLDHGWRVTTDDGDHFVSFYLQPGVEPHHDIILENSRVILQQFL